jgi:putative membrane protein
MKIVSVVIAIGLALWAGPALAKDSKQFLRESIEGHNGEIVLGQLAQLRAGSDSVREYGRALATDHAAGKVQALALATKIGLVPPDAPSKEAAKEKDKVDKMEGAEFDREFVSYMVKDHEHDIREYEEETMAKDADPEIVAYANMMLPKLRQHLDMAKNLEKQVKSEK